MHEDAYITELVAVAPEDHDLESVLNSIAFLLPTLKQQQCAIILSIL
jgi:hypothetical protein